MSSSAFGDLRARLDEVRTLSALDPARSGDVSQPSVSNAVNRAAIVLLTAHVEGYLEDLVSEALDQFVANAAPVERLPLLLRALHAEHHLRQIEPMSDRNVRAPRIAKMFAAEAPMWTTGTLAQAHMIQARLVCAEMSNPGSREIAAFLELIGVRIEDYLAGIGASASLSQIDGLVHRRNQIAHGEANATGAFGDVDTYLGIVGALAHHIDSAVAGVVQTICGLGAEPW